MVALRELTAKLGFDVDMTGVNRFEKGIDSSRRKVEGFNFVNLGGFRSALNKTLVFAGTAFAAVGAGAAAAFKFTDIEASLEALRFATQDSFGALKSEIDSILDDKVLKNLITEIDLVNSALFEAQTKGVKGETITDFLRLAALLSVQVKKPLQEVLGLITGFAVEGDLGIFKLLRQLPPELQELFKKAGISPAQVGFVGRREKILESIRAVEEELEKNIIRQRERGILTFRELTGVLDKLAVEVGEKALPAFSDLNKELIPFVERLTGLVRGDVGIREVLAPRAAPGSERAKRIEETKAQFEAQLDFFKSFFRGPEDVIKRGLPPGARFQGFEVKPGITNQANTTSQRTSVNVTNNVIVQGGGGGNAAEIGREVEKANRRTLGNVKELNERTTIRKGG